MLDKGFIQELISPAIALPLLTAKLGGGVRIYYNYRGLNNITIKN
jgi:hypothetical protein